MEGPKTFKGIPGSPEAIDALREMIGEDVTAENLLTALQSVQETLQRYDERRVEGSPEAKAHLQALMPEGQVVTLDWLDDKLLDLRVGQERALNSLAKANHQKAPEHTIEECAGKILSCCPPQVTERMEEAVQSTQRQVHAIIAGTLIMWMRDFIGADFTEVREPGPAIIIGTQPWSSHEIARQPQGAVVIQAGMAVCETCQQGFHTLPTQHKPRFGCAACGKAAALHDANKREWERGQANPRYQPTIRPPMQGTELPDAAARLHFAIYMDGQGPCTCGQPMEANPAA